MATVFLDANVVLRYLMQDNPQQARDAYDTLRAIEQGSITATISEGAIADIVYVLASKVLFNASRSFIRERVSAVLELAHLRIEHKRTYLRALEHYELTNLPFNDCLIVAHMERLEITGILSFDREYDRVPGVHRIVPGTK